MSLFRSSFTVGSMTLISRIFGLIRDILTATVLGAGPLADVFFVALKLPNFFRRITAEGAFTVAFIPLYSKLLRDEGDHTAGSFAANILGWMILCLGVFVALMVLFMPQLLHILAPGFVDDPLRFDPTVDLARITMPYILMMSVTALLGGVLNTHKHFWAFAVVPTLFNICLITALLLGHQGALALPQTVTAMAIAVVVSGIFQALILFGILAAKKISLPLSELRPRRTERHRRLLRLMIPATIGSGVTQVNSLVDIILASFLPIGAVSYLYYADRLVQLPLALIGTAIATVLLPQLSQALSHKNTHNRNGRTLFLQSFVIALLIGLPAATGLVILAEPILGTLFGHGALTPEDVRMASLALMALAVGLPAFILQKVLTTCFFAHEDTKTPLRCSMISVGCNIVFSLLLIGPLAHVGLALGTSLAAWVQVACLGVMIRPLVTNWNLRRPLVLLGSKICVAAIAMGAVLYWGYPLLESWARAALSESLVTTIFILGAGIGFGIILYASTLIGFGVISFHDLRRKKLTLNGV